MKALIASLLAALSMGLAVAGPFEDGVAAYGRKDYKEALKLWKPLAELGEAAAQHKLGVMYAYGEGVPQDYAEAIRWYKLAAAQGYSDAQNNLGGMYGSGNGTTQDYVRAHLWYNLAATTGNPAAVHNRSYFAKKMTPQQIAQAQKMARECLASNYKKCD